MARKRPNPIEEPPTASSSDEEEEEEKGENSSEEEEGSSSEEEEDDVPVSQPPKKPETPAPATVPEDSDESGSESESESDSDSPTPIVKPIATKPMEETSNAKKPRSKPLASPVKPTAAKSAAKSAVKRPSESEQQESKDNKRAKKKAGEEGNVSTPAAEEVKKTGEDAKKLFQRLFTEEDEIALLKGMLDYAAKKGTDPCVDINAFYDFVKKSIHTDVTKNQLMDKIRRLKKKYENNAGKGKKGEDRTFSKPHEQKSFELSKKIWGKDGVSEKVESSAAKSNGKAKSLAALKADLQASPEKKKVDDGEPMDLDKEGSRVCLFDKKFGVGSLEEEVLKHGLEIIGGEKRADLEQKWRKIQIAELELFMQRSELIKEQAKLLLEFYKSEDK